MHEFSHTLADAIKVADSAWHGKLKATYKKAMDAGRFAGSYAANNAANNEQEYWAEGTQDWFSCNDPSKSAIHNGIWTREQVKAYDPDLAELLAGVYGDGPWRYIRSDGQPLIIGDKSYVRPAADLAHLQGLNRADFPAFDFDKSLNVQAFKASQKTETDKN